MPRHFSRALRVLSQELPPVEATELPPTPPENTPPVEPPAVPPVTPVQPETDPKVFDEAYVKGLRTENANARIKNKELTDRIEELERKERSELDNLKLDVGRFKDEIVPSLSRENQVLRVQVEAAKLGIVDPEVASMLVDWDAVAAGTPVVEALETVINSRPWLKKVQGSENAEPPTTPPVTPPVTPHTPTTSNPAVPPAPARKTYTKSQLSSMPQAQMMAEMADINYALENKLVDLTR